MPLVDFNHLFKLQMLAKLRAIICKPPKDPQMDHLSYTPPG